MADRIYSTLDRLLTHVDQAMRTLFAPIIPERSSPADSHGVPSLTKDEQRRVAGLMRVNHAGEIAAQALYHGQALTAKRAQVRDKMEQAAREENDHLAWCEQRLQELGSHVSRLNGLWYAGSFAIGALAGLAGDKWSLGFVAETERQVVRHLEAHLKDVPHGDEKSRAVLERMKEEERRHATGALLAGGKELPFAVRRLMSFTSKIMTKTAYWI